MSTVYTDYTQQSTLLFGYGQQSRIVKYVRDLINNWFADSRNIKDLRILSLMYDKKGNLSKNCVRFSTPFDPDKVYSGTTPAILVSLGNIQYQASPVNTPGNMGFSTNPLLAPIKYNREKTVPMTVTVITLNYDGTILLALLLLMFFVMNKPAILADCNSLSSFDVGQISAPTLVQEGQVGNAKKLYASNISIVTQCYVSWTMDTQGPVFKGVKVNSNFK